MTPNRYRLFVVSNNGNVCCDMLKFFHFRCNLIPFISNLYRVYTKFSIPPLNAVETTDFNL